jgi:hypothetical protein
MFLENIPETQKRRIQYIEQCLLWRREYTYRLSIERFGVSKAQAVKDLKLYCELNPSCLSPYDPKIKAHVPKLGFTPRFGISAFDGFSFDGMIEQAQVLKRKEMTPVLTKVMDAKQAGKAVEVIYRSFSHPLGLKRTIFPTQIIWASNRIHFRGYCLIRNKYRDFVIARCVTLPKLIDLPIEQEIPEDVDWDDQVTVALMVNPQLNSDAQAMILEEYIDSLNRSYVMPSAMVRYFIVDNNLPGSNQQKQQAVTTPESYPILIKSIDYINKAT